MAGTLWGLDPASLGYQRLALLRQRLSRRAFVGGTAGAAAAALLAACGGAAATPTVAPQAPQATNTPQPTRQSVVAPTIG
ncbi:MAG TPA: hypothetical protein VFW96_10285, partial [Thermomicrobiales bacterium]|nr:hypothetical protein [Thermomicrobiales bacterium]